MRARDVGTAGGESTMRRRWLVVGVAAVLAVPLVWAAIHLLGGVLSAAFWYALWRANLVVKTIPQEAFWVLFLCLSAALAVSSLLGRRTTWQGQRGATALKGGLVRELTHSIGRATGAYYFRWLLAGRLSRLILEAMDASGQSAEGPRRQWWAKNSEDVPTEIKAYVEAALWGGFWRPAGMISGLRHSVSPGEVTSPLDLNLETVVRFLEDQVEGADERRRP